LAVPQTHAERVDLLGVRFVPWTETDVLDAVFGALADAAPGARGGWIVPTNVDVLRKIVHDDAVRELVSPADAVIADGMPLVWASRLQGTPLPERVTGAALLPRLCERAEAERRSVYLLGGADGVAAAGVAALRRLHPRLRVDGWSPRFGLEATEAGMVEIRRRVVAAEPDLVFCGFGFPKQERVIAGLRDTLPDVWFVSCGAALTFAAGEVSRAPHWMQRSGLEWVHRLVKEPSRMFRRYVIEDIPFALRLLATSAWRRRR
jgi:N-acetylglucosaminyldiphosphoundecaprenol N-acetyl-beta-D-mannosaminyltransferase